MPESFQCNIFNSQFLGKKAEYRSIQQKPLNSFIVLIAREKIHSISAATDRGLYSGSDEVSHYKGKKIGVVIKGSTRAWTLRIFL